jgi:hypothetical protein
VVNGAAACRVDDLGDVGLDGRAPVPMLSSGTTTAGALRAGAAVDRMYNDLVRVDTPQ